MVVRLVGKVNSEPVIFEWKSGDRWEAIVPKIPSGVYVVELSAYDEAGNMAYLSRFLLGIDLTALCMKVWLKEIGGRENEKGFLVVVEEPTFFYKVRVGEPCDCI